MEKEINVKELKEESKKLNLQIKELKKKYITSIENKKNKIDETIKDTIRCPKCKKYFKHVYLDRVISHHNYGKSGYFGDEVTEYVSICNVLECPSCFHKWEVQVKNAYLNCWKNLDDCNSHTDDELVYIPRKVKIDSNDNVIYPKKKTKKENK